MTLDQQRAIQLAKYLAKRRDNAATHDIFKAWLVEFGINRLSECSPEQAVIMIDRLKAVILDEGLPLPEFSAIGNFPSPSKEAHEVFFLRRAWKLRWDEDAPPFDP